MISLLSYLKRNPESHVVLLKHKQQVDSFRVLFLDEKSISDACLKRIHIKYLSTYHEVNKFIVAASAGYHFSLIAIDNWNMFYEFVDGTEYRDDSMLERNRTIALLKQCGCPVRVVDNGLTLSRLRQTENVIRYWFEDVFVARRRTVSDYSLTNLFGSEQDGHPMECSFSADHIIAFSGLSNHD
ncbi:hypothetical protein WA171_002693 [Blastocystis sp. BT1]